MINIKCLFGLHDWKEESFWHQIVGANGNKLHPIKNEWFNELQIGLRKNKVPNDWFPCFRSVCKKCGKKGKIKIDSLYPATEGLYPKFKVMEDSI